MASDPRLMGSVLEAGTRLPIGGATVLVGDHQVESGVDGTFALSSVPTGTVRILVGHAGYAPYATEQAIEANVETHVKLYLRRASNDSFETVVLGKKDEKEVEKRTLSHDEMVKIPGGMGDPLRAVQALPGVGRSPFGLGTLVIRGADPADSAYYVDGLRLDYLYHFGALTSVLPAQLIDQVTLYPGNFGVRYGRATAGIVEIQTTPAVIHRFRFKASVDLAQAALSAEIPLPQETSLMLGFRRSYLDAVLPALLPAIVADAPTLLPAYTDYQARLAHRTDRLGEFILFFYGSHDSLALTQDEGKTTGVSNPTELRYINAFNALQPRWTWKISPHVTHSLSLLGSYTLVDVSTPQTNYKRVDWQIGGREEFAVKLSHDVDLLVGVDGMGGTYDFSARLPIDPGFTVFPSPLSLAPPLTDKTAKGVSYDVATYAEADVKIGALRLTPGLRVALMSTKDSAPLQSLQPRFNARYSLSRNVQLKAGIGLYERAADTAGVIPGRLSNVPVRSLQNSFGVEWQPLSALSVDVTGFFNEMWNQSPVSNTLLVTQGALAPSLYSNDQQGRSYGVQLLLRVRPYKGFFGWVSYTLSRSERQSPNENWHLFDFDQTHLLTLVASYQLPYGFQIGVRMRLVSGNPFTPVTRSVFDGDTGGYQPIAGEKNSSRLPLFHQLDVRIDKAFIFDTWQLALYLDVQNAYNTRNVEFSQSSYDFRKTGYLYGLPIVPIIGIEGSY